jgi:hypothetical protein
VYHPFTIGVAASDSFTSTRCMAFYQFSVSAQTNLRIALTSPGFQTFLQLVDSSGKILMNSVLTASLDTATTVRMMLGTGSYSVSVIPFNQGQSGKYRLVAVTDTSAVGGCAPVWATPGITTTQAITSADCSKSPSGASYFTHVYALMLRTGQSIDLSEYSTALAPGFILTGPDGAQPSTPDSLGTTARLSTTIGGQGAYRLWVGSVTAGQVGTYTLQIQ